MQSILVISHHPFPPSNNSQISSNTSTFLIHVLFLILVYNPLRPIYASNVHMDVELFTGHGNLSMPKPSQIKGTLPPQSSTANSISARHGTMRSPPPLAVNFNCVNFLWLLCRQQQLLGAYLCNRHVIFRSPHITACLPIFQVLQSLCLFSVMFPEPWR